MPKTTPVVFSIVSFPAKVGFIKSFEHSGNNLVGTSNFVESRHFIRLLTAILPQTKTAAIFRRKNEPNSAIQKNQLARLLTEKGICFIDLPGESAEELSSKAIQYADRTDIFIGMSMK
ncbi:ABC transporter substrate binding protein [Desulfonema magnum]|uniref:ABC transporter, solute-binding protein n=1 Tax=Desulfonema magnum TaxID=45655 RepID=A0A975GPL1_9BACT|nr:ABC transporter substrate binding protein [Desulfonema magnum]QTA89126.1 putative ABC transporter, solute-binding protein [Desulfonema magnum]